MKILSECNLDIILIHDIHDLLMLFINLHDKYNAIIIPFYGKHIDIQAILKFQEYYIMILK